MYHQNRTRFLGKGNGTQITVLGNRKVVWKKEAFEVCNLEGDDGIRRKEKKKRKVGVL